MSRKGIINSQDLPHLIIMAIAAKGSPMSRLDICRALGRAKSPHILAVIDQLEVSDWLCKTNGITKRGMHVFLYFLSSKYFDQQDEFKQHSMFSFNEPIVGGNPDNE